MKTSVVVMGMVVAMQSATALAQDLKIADGSSSGTYSAMFKEIQKMCGVTIPMSEVGSSGAIDNLDKLVGNEVNAAFLHSDVIAYRAKTEDLTGIKTLLDLFPEDVHFLALNRALKSGGVFGYGGKETLLMTVSDLAGRRVGAAGGGYVTAQMIRLQGEVPYTVVQYGGGREVMDALNKGEIAAAVFVGAAPLPNLRDLGPEYKLLSVGESVAAKLKAIYRLTTVVYTKMSTSSVQTVAADALLVTREYRTPKFVAALKSFHDCFVEHLDELKETPGTHRAWQKVRADTVPKWPAYEFASVARSRAPAARERR